MYNYYIKLLGYPDVPEFLKKYLTVPSLVRLKGIGYFCGMDYASKDVYDFKCYISRYMHSLSTALLVYKLTSDKTYTLQALFHDVSTPVFSHVIDYMNKDYLYQESTEEFTEFILKNDKVLLRYLDMDNVKVEDLINYKSSSIVDNKRPKMCADRLDGIILNGLYWTKTLTKRDIFYILKDTEVYLNECHELEIGFKTEEVLNKVVLTNDLTDKEMHSSYDTYMMELLASITRYLIDKRYIGYEDLYFYTERELFKRMCKINDKTLQSKMYEFRHILKSDIPCVMSENIKVRKVSPILNGQRRG